MLLKLRFSKNKHFWLSIAHKHISGRAILDRSGESDKNNLKFLKKGFQTAFLVLHLYYRVCLVSRGKKNANPNSHIYN